MSANVYPIAYLDSPKVLEAFVTNIPGAGASPLQVVANIGFKAAYAVDFIDSIGDFIGVYYGASGSEALAGIIGGGLNSRAWMVIPALSRVSLRSMTASPITNGLLTITFMGYGGPPGTQLP